MRHLLLLLVLPVVAACNYDPLSLLQNQGPADVRDLDADDSRPTVDGGQFEGSLEGSDIGSGNYSGATFTFTGTGDRVCLIIDPQSVWRDDLQLGPDGDVANPWLDNHPYDDGDLDLLAGLASYYTGTPGVELGDFFGSFPDSNGVDRAVDLNLCLMEDYHGSSSGTAGRATPEWCSFDTEPDVIYMGVLRVFSVPVDDDVLLYQLDVRTGECPEINECTLRGDFDPVPDNVELPEGYSSVENMYCDGY